MQNVFSRRFQVNAYGPVAWAVLVRPFGALKASALINAYYDTTCTERALRRTSWGSANVIRMRSRILGKSSGWRSPMCFSRSSVSSTSPARYAQENRTLWPPSRPRYGSEPPSPKGRRSGGFTPPKWRRIAAVAIERSTDLFLRSAAFRFKSSCNDCAKFATHLRAGLCRGQR
jgi:hypothetical protein